MTKSDRVGADEREEDGRRSGRDDDEAETINLTYITNTTKRVSCVGRYPGSDLFQPPGPRMACHARQERGLQLAGLALGKQAMLAQSHDVSAPRSRASSERHSSAARSRCEARTRVGLNSPSKVSLDGEWGGAHSGQKRPSKTRLDGDRVWMGMDGDGWACRGAATMRRSGP